MAKIGNLFEYPGEIKFEWEILDFSSLSNEKGICYISPKFYFSGASWRLCMFPNGEETGYESNDSIGIYIMRTSTGSPISVNFSLGFKSASGIKYPLLGNTKIFYDNQFGIGYNKFISRWVLLENKSEFTPSDVLTVICILKNSGPNNVDGSLFSRHQELSDNLKEIFEDEKNTDFLLKIDGDDVPVHRMILEARSPVFAAMFSHDTKESQTGEVSIVDIDKTTMEDILEFMYTGDFENPTTESVLSLYAAAEKYDIKDVKKICSEFVLGNLSVEWVCDVIKFSELYHDEKISLRVREFFKENVRQIIKTEKWKEFVKENHEISIELLHSVVTAFVPE